MEIRQYILLLRKWSWLLFAGVILGALAGFVFSRYQETIYETMTRVMVSRALQEDKTGYYVYTDIQLAKTYAQLVTAEPVLQLLAKKLGFPIERRNIRVEQIPDSLLLEVRVQDGNPERAVQIANGLVEVFIEYNDALQSRRYEASETSLNTQISQIEDQITSLQTEMELLSAQSLETQKLQVEERAREIEAQLTEVEGEIIDLETQKANLGHTSAITGTASTSGGNPVLSSEDKLKAKELELRLEQTNELYDLYKQVYANLRVLGTDENSAEKRAARQEQLQTTLALYRQIYANLLSNYENVRLARLNNTPNVAQVEPASLPEYPIQPQPLRNTLLGGISGLFIMTAIAFLSEYLNDTIKTPEDVLHFLHLPVIGLIGEMETSREKRKDPGVFVTENPLSHITEGFRTLRTNLDFASVDKPLRTLLITSAGPSEGKTTVAVNLAAVMAQGEKKVILVDTDLRRPAVHNYLHLANRRGLSDLFRNQTRLSNVIVSWGNPPFAVITSGDLPPNPTELLSSREMEKIVADLTEKSDIVIVDSPPAIVADPIALSAKLDGVLLVIEPGKTRIDSIQVVLEQLERAGARVVGVVLNPISKRRGHYYTKYTYYSNYYDSRSKHNHYFNPNGSSKRDQKEKTTQEGRVDSPAD